MTFREDAAQTAQTRMAALSALFAYLGLDRQSRPLVLLTRFDVLPEAECHEGFYVTVGDAPYEVYRLRGSGYDVASSDDLSPSFATSTDEEKKRQFACAVALHAYGLTFREVIEVEAQEVTAPECGSLLPAQSRTFRVTFRTQADSLARVIEVDEVPVGDVLEYVVRGQGGTPHFSPPAAAGRTLLILGCSACKKPTTELLPAIDRYDGPLYRVLRKCLREGTVPQALDILIISARYGLLRASDWVEYYDQRMTKSLAAQMRDGIMLRLAAELSGKRYSQAHISLGAHYLEVLGGVEQLSPYVGQVSLASGGIGQRQAQLRGWLLGGSEAADGCFASPMRADN